jgi:hypothetical protein
MSGEDRRYQVPPDGKVHYFFQPLTAPQPGTEGFVAGRIIRVAPDGSVTSYFAGSGGNRVNPNVPLDLVAIPGSVQDLVRRRKGDIDADASAVFTLGNTKFDEDVNPAWRIDGPGGRDVTDISIVLDFNRQALDGLPQGNRGGLVIHSSRGRQASFDVEVDGVRRTIRVPRSAGCVTLIGDECDRFADQYREDLRANLVAPNFVVIPTNVALVRGDSTLTWAGRGSEPSGATYAAATPSSSPSTTGGGDRQPTATDRPVVPLADATSPDPVTPASANLTDGLLQVLAELFEAFFGGGNVRQTFASGTDAGPGGVTPEGGPTVVAAARPTRNETAPTVQA